MVCFGISKWPLGSVQTANRHGLDHQHQHPFRYRHQPQHNRSYGRRPVRRPNLWHSLKRWHCVPGRVRHRQRHADGDERQFERPRHPGLRHGGHRPLRAAGMATEAHAGARRGDGAGLQTCGRQWQRAWPLGRPHSNQNGRHQHRIPSRQCVLALSGSVSRLCRVCVPAPGRHLGHCDVHLAVR